MTAISANIPLGLVNVPYTPERFALGCTEGFLDVLRAEGVDADVDLSSLTQVVLFQFGWAANVVHIRYTLNSDPATVLTEIFGIDDDLNGRTAFWRAMNRGLNNMLRARIGTSAFTITEFIIQREGEYPRGWNANNALSLRTTPVNKIY